MRYVLILLGLLVANVASAIDCQTLPDCAELGYSKEDVKGCADNGYLNCPFDQDYKVCVQYNCEALGFTEDDKTSWCADLIECRDNDKMTLCQKPCFATNYEELKELVGSGKCKIVTMRNDIEMPKNEGITLHADTIIDGGNHTITSSGNIKNLTIFSMNDKTGMKNLKLHHTQTETQEAFSLVKALTTTNNVSLENMDISVSSNANMYAHGFAVGPGIYNIRGKFALDIQANSTLFAFYSSTNFTDAQVSIKIKGQSGDMVASGSKTTFVNSTINADIEGCYLINGALGTFKNSKANLKGCLFWNGGGKSHLILEESSVTLASDSISHKETANITLKGTTEHPSVLSMTFKNNGYTDIITTNTTDTLVLNGVTYRPKQPATTKLSEVTTSGNWKAE